MANDKQVHAKLKGLQKAWDRAEEKRPDQQLDDGDYVGKPVEMSVNVAKSGRVQCVTRWQVTQGKAKGGSIRRYDGLEDETQMSYFKGYAAILGFEVPENLTDIPEAVEDFVKNNDDEYKMSVRTQKEGDFKNVYINGLADAEGLEHEDEEDNKPKNTKGGKKKDVEAEAEDEFEFEEEQNVIVTLKSGKVVEGTVIEFDDNTVTIQDEDEDQFEIKKSRIESVEEKKKKSSGKKG